MAPSHFLTIGHSNRSLEEFIELLQENAVTEVQDVRKLAGSARHPQFNADALGRSLNDVGIAFSRIEAFAGRRPVSRDVPFSTNAWWQNRSFHNYADHALADKSFSQALRAELATGASRRALMCAEAVWWRCHRRIIADHLLANGASVTHILGPGQTMEAVLSAGATVTERGVEYPAMTRA